MTFRQARKLFKKWTICWWKHKEDRCYPEVWKEELGYWHCHKCDPCGEQLEEWLRKLQKGAQDE